MGGDKDMKEMSDELQDLISFKAESYWKHSGVYAFKEGAEFCYEHMINRQEILESKESQFESTIKETMKVRDELNEKLKVATEALEFYADLKSYYVNGAWDFRNHIDNSDLEMVLIYGDYINVGGKKARETLDKLKGEQNENK